MSKPPSTFSAPRDLSPAEIESLRAHKKELTQQAREIYARRAAEKKAEQESGVGPDSKAGHAFRACVRALFTRARGLSSR